MSFRKAYRRYRTLWVSIMACSAFLALAVWGWGVRPGELAGFLGAAAVLLVGLILLAALLGFVIFKLRRRFERDVPPLESSAPKNGNGEHRK